MNCQALCDRMNAFRAGISSILIAVRCLVRGLPLFLSSRPRTPLRVLCLIAFDVLHRLRSDKPLPKQKLAALAALLDFGACANAALDHKDFCRHEFYATRRLLDESGIGTSVDEYLRRLEFLESTRPSPGGDERQFQKVRLYREAIVRLSLGMVAAIAHDNPCLDAEISAISCDSHLKILFQIVMQCQIIDDVLDYPQDLAAQLPSFLTASESLVQAFELTRLSALRYADDRDLPRTGDLFPLRSALLGVSGCAELVIALGRLLRQGFFHPASRCSFARAVRSRRPVL